MEKKQAYTYILLVFGLLLLYLLQGSFLGYQFKPYYGQPTTNIFGTGAYDILDLYYAYPNWIDFILFLVIFIGVGMYALGDRFGSAGKSVYVALGIILALGIVMWEARTGFYFLEVIGPYSFLILIIVLGIIAWKWLTDMTGSGAFGTAIALLIFFIFFMGVVNNFGGAGYLLFDFIYYSPFFALLLGIAPLVIVILLVVGIIYLIKRFKGD